jgi:hypothetical protein
MGKALELSAMIYYLVNHPNPAMLVLPQLSSSRMVRKFFYADIYISRCEVRLGNPLVSSD